MILQSGFFYAEKIVFILILGIGSLSCVAFVSWAAMEMSPFPPRPLHTPLVPALVLVRPFFFELI